MNNKLLQSEKLPKGWKWVKLGEVIEEALPGFACGQRDPKGIIQVRMNNVDTFGNLILNDFIRVPANDELVKKYALKKDDVLFNNTNSVELVGKTAIFKNHSEPVVYSNHFTRIRPIENLLLPVYLAKWLLNQWQNKIFEKICNRWVGQSAIKNGKLLNLYIPLPSLSEQKKIVKILEEKLDAVEKAKKAAEEKLRAANTLKQSYLDQIFNEEKLQKNLPQGWNWIKLGDVCEKMSNGTSTLQNQEKIGLPVTRIETISKGYIDKEKVGWIDLCLSDVASFQLNIGDILVSHINSVKCLGNCAIYSGHPNILIHGMNLLRLQIKDADSEYVFNFLKSNTAKKYFENNARRAIGQASINIQVMSKLRIPLPRIEDQKRIAKNLNHQFEKTDKLAENIQNELELINKLPRSYLKQAFEGKL